MNKIEREAFKRLLSIAIKKEIHVWHHPLDEELERLWDERIDKEIDKMEKIFGDDGR